MNDYNEFIESLTVAQSGTQHYIFNNCKPEFLIKLFCDDSLISDRFLNFRVECIQSLYKRKLFEYIIESEIIPQLDNPNWDIRRYDQKSNMKLETEIKVDEWIIVNGDTVYYPRNIVQKAINEFNNRKTIVVLVDENVTSLTTLEILNQELVGNVENMWIDDNTLTVNCEVNLGAKYMHLEMNDFGVASFDYFDPDGKVYETIIIAVCIYK